jgi:hypothetical protein
MHSKRISRLLETDKLINELNYSKDEAAQELSVSTKTIERDLIQLKEFKESSLDAEKVNSIRNQLYLQLCRASEEIYESFTSCKERGDHLNANRYYTNFLSTMARIADIHGLSSGGINIAVGLSTSNTVREPREKVDPELAQRFSSAFVSWHEEKRKREFEEEQSSYGA